MTVPNPFSSQDCAKPSVLAADLARWAQELVDQGRSPFRRVEAQPQLLSSQGILHPHLVFWINRESFMAGGLLLLATGSVAEVFAQGRACAQALGLSHFLTWRGQEITFWADEPSAPRAVKVLELPPEAEQRPGGLRWALQEILEALKPLAILGAVPPEQLSPYYLANLCRSPLRLTHDELEAAFRGGRVDADSASGLSVPALVSAKGGLTLARLLALMSANQVPETVQPEKLERALELALPYLAPPLAQALQPFAGELPLPHASAVRFHHLFRRLGQLRWGRDSRRAVATLEILVDQRRRRLGLPPAKQDRTLAADTLVVNPVCPQQAAGPFHEVHQDATLRALLGLLRDLRGAPAPATSSADIMHLQPRPPLSRIEGTLIAQDRPLGQGDKELFRVCLRASWPHRRPQFPARAPRWLYEAVHLLGLAAEEARIEIDLPDAWLRPGNAQPLVAILLDQFRLQTLVRIRPGCVRLDVEKTAPAAPPLEVTQGLATALVPNEVFPEEAWNAWLGAAADILSEEVIHEGAAAQTEPERRIDEEERARIIAGVFADGLPRFPETYLYEHYRPELREFTLRGPLRMHSLFLGTCELVDEAGHILEVQGEETAQALILASHGDARLVRLPCDRQVTAAIVAKYLADLQELRQKLLRETFSRREKSQTARQWAKRIWDSLPLPPWDQLPEQQP
ncbi:hypothetical protein [Geoalkalibacter sp.]|uniref:hypothetical protein n=1 Tax=Geoalkalibacter sp. TaxID=3041440 RepID=UPI00272EB699|nr:hypothetical protein [Geoalkalibacter sp.]